MTREETIGDARLLLGDCREILPTLGRVDAVVTDPPFGIKDKPMLDLPGRGGRGNNDYHIASDWDAEIDPAFAQLCGAAADTVAWFGHWRKRAEVEQSIGLPLRAEIIWAKDTHVGPPCPVAMRDERIWLFAKNGIRGATFETSVWDHPIIPTWAHKHHKNEKPVGLMQRLVAFIGAEIVCDPFMGSGTTGVACVKSGVRFIGIEREREHFETACRRIEAATKEPRLPLAEPKMKQTSLLDSAR